VFILLGLFWGPFGKYIKSQSKRAISSAIGIIIVVCLVACEAALKFNISSFGLVIAVLIIFLFGFVVYSIMKSRNVSLISAFSFSFLIVIILSEMILPQIFQWPVIKANIVWIYILMSIIIIILLYRGIRRIYRRKTVYRTFNLGDL